MKKSKENKKAGAIGIGTLIVFIALILVAAIAAAVIIGTAEDLEERAEGAGESAERLVEASPVIKIAEGDVGGTSNQVETVYLYIDLYGSEGVDMKDVTLHVVATPSGGTAVSDDLNYNEGSPTSATADYYGTEEILDPNDQYNPGGSPATYILGERARLKLEIDMSAALTNLPQDSVLEIYMTVTTSGHQSYSLYRTPASYPSSGIVALDD